MEFSKNEKELLIDCVLSTRSLITERIEYYQTYLQLSDLDQKHQKHGEEQYNKYVSKLEDIENLIKKVYEIEVK